MTALHLITPALAPAADLPALAAWVRAEPKREARIAWAGKAWWVELFTRHSCVASVGHADPVKALSRALKIAREDA